MRGSIIYYCMIIVIIMFFEKNQNFSDVILVKRTMFSPKFKIT